MSLQDTPQSQRLTLGIFGKTNSGKSSLLNAITDQEFALVSDTAGTTTDPVYKTMEIQEIGPVVFIDTAGFADSSKLGSQRLKKTMLALEKTDVALLVIDIEDFIKLKENSCNCYCNKQNIKSTDLNPASKISVFYDEIFDFIDILKKKNIPFLLIVNKFDLLKKSDEKSDLKTEHELKQENKNEFTEKILFGEKNLIDKNILYNHTDFFNIPRQDLIFISAKNKIGIENIVNSLKKKIPQDFSQSFLTKDLCNEGDIVILVMPQDIQAPKGRLILPQVQILRELLDKKCIPICCTEDKFCNTLNSLGLQKTNSRKNNRKVRLIISDSQVFKNVYQQKPKNVPLTSFSVLLAANKGNVKEFIKGASFIEKLTPKSRILIAEACTHVPLTEDIGRVKIPAKLREYIEDKYSGGGKELTINFVRGIDFPAKLNDYDLIIHCGSCMFNRNYVLTRQEKAEKQKVPMTNYGLALAFFDKILDKIVVPQ
ncbi:MAG: GTPase [Treponemataceae bacterium]